MTKFDIWPSVNRNTHINSEVWSKKTIIFMLEKKTMHTILSNLDEERPSTHTWSSLQNI